MLKIVIVILNYMNYEDTIECVQCSLNQNYKNYDIVVVENGSSNDSYERLFERYSHHPKVFIIKSNKNLGFAKGNNIGIQYAMDKRKADYVFVCNSDIIFREDLFDQILSEPIDGFGAISPTVYNLDYRHQPPSISTNNCSHYIINTIVNLLIMSLLYCFSDKKIVKIKKVKWFLVDIKRKVSNLYIALSNKCRSITFHNKIYKTKGNNRVNKAKSNRKINKTISTHRVNLTKSNAYSIKCYMLQGCAFVLTPEFFRFYKKLYPKTFLYWEEINLITYLDKVNLRAKIIDTSPVIHKEKMSTKRIYKKSMFQKKKLQLSRASMFQSLPMFFMRYKTIIRKYG